MKDKRLSTKMRWTAGVVYGVLAVVELMSLRFMINKAAFSNVPIAWLIELGVMFGAAILAVWLLCGNAVLPVATRRAVVVATTLVVIFELVSYSTHTEAINYTLAEWFPILAQVPNPIYLLIVMILRLLLMILAAFFVQSASAEMDMEQAEENMEKAFDNIDQVLEKVDEASKNGLDEETAEEIVEAADEAREELTGALEELDRAIDETEKEKN